MSLLSQVARCYPLNSLQLDPSTPAARQNGLTGMDENRSTVVEPHTGSVLRLYRKAWGGVELIVDCPAQTTEAGQRLRPQLTVTCRYGTAKVNGSSTESRSLPGQQL